MERSERTSYTVEPLILSAVVVFLLCLGGFILMVDAVRGGGHWDLDKEILLAFRNSAADPVGPSSVEDAMADISALGSFPVIMTVFLMVFGFLILRKQYRLALFLLIAVLGGTALAYFLKMMFMRPRPDLVTHLSGTQTSSFPSGHSMSAAVVYLTLGALLAETFHQKRIKFYILSWAVLIVLAVGISRVYLGVHWPSDVLAGWAGGVGWALFCWMTARALRLPLMKRHVI